MGGVPGIRAPRLGLGGSGGNLRTPHCQHSHSRPDRFFPAKSGTGGAFFCHRDLGDTIDTQQVEENDSPLPPGVQSNMNTTASPLQHSPHVQRSAATPAAAGIGHKQDNFSVDEGIIVLQWPQQMSANSFQDFEDWMEIQMRKIKRTIAKNEDEKGEGE